MKDGMSQTRREFLEGVIGAAAVLGSAAVLAPAKAPGLTTLRVVAIPTRPLPIGIALEQGIFTRHGLEVQLEVPPLSDALRAALASGKADIAHSVVDNAVALVQSGAAADTVIVMGGEESINEVIAQPEIHSVGELRGKTLAVDAVNTGYALQLKKILAMNGLKPGDYELKPVGTTPHRLEAMRKEKQYAASMMGPPTSLVAKHEGFVSLGETQKLIGKYQALGAFVRRSWAEAHSDALVRYLAAYIEAQRWLMAPANRQRVIELLVQEWKLTLALADETYRLMGGWYEEDARLDTEAFANALKLRAEVEGQWGGKAPAPEKYLDLSYYERALKSKPPA